MLWLLLALLRCVAEASSPMVVPRVLLNNSADANTSMPLVGLLSPPMPGGCFMVPNTNYKFAPGNVFPDDPQHPHGLRRLDSAAKCCALCQSLKNCSFFTYAYGGTAAKPTCYSQAGGCCYLKGTAGGTGGKDCATGCTSGSTKPLPPPPPPPAVQLQFLRGRYGNSSTGIPAPAVSRNTSGWSGAEPSRWGFEGGKAVEINGTVHVFTAEMYRAPWNVAMRLAHWACDPIDSIDGGGCHRVSTLRTSTNDTSGADPLASLWEPVPVYDSTAERWHLFYVGYHSWCSSPDDVTCAPVIYRGNVNGTIYHATSATPGLQGIGGPYTNDTAVLHCGEGGNIKCPDYSLGFNSMHPYGPVDGKWFALLGGGGGASGIFFVSAPDLAGPWTVGDGATFLDPRPPHRPMYVENPVVNPVPAALGGGFICMVDCELGGLDSSSFCISYSANGTDWSPQLQAVPVPGGCRTPLGIAEYGSMTARAPAAGAGASLTLVYTFSDDHRDFAWGPALPRGGLFEGIFIADVALTKS